jgi:hypothetical protein
MTGDVKAHFTRTDDNDLHWIDPPGIEVVGKLSMVIGSIRGLKTEVRGQKSVVRGQRSEDGEQTIMDRR